jgi:hypothetical protein
MTYSVTTQIQAPVIFLWILPDWLPPSSFGLFKFIFSWIARMMLVKHKHFPVTPLLRSPQWFPISPRAKPTFLQWLQTTSLLDFSGLTYFLFFCLSDASLGDLCAIPFYASGMLHLLFSLLERLCLHRSLNTFMFLLLATFTWGPLWYSYWKSNTASISQLAVPSPLCLSPMTICLLTYHQLLARCLAW